jgi:hypothetical protein
MITGWWWTRRRTTGSNGAGYATLTPAVRAVIEEDLAHISRLLRTGDYNEVRYSSASKSGPLGTGIFDVGAGVNKFIVAGLRRVVADCSM